METIAISKSRDDGADSDLETVKPQEIPIMFCVIFYNTEICYRGCGEKTSFLAII